MTSPDIRLPSKTVDYKGPITDTSRWQSFKSRPGDIFICTPPKCGTTWTQAIVAMLVFGKADHGEMPGIISPWIDANFAPIDDYLLKVDAQQHRRFIKTHTPLDGIPYFEDCTYLVVCRDPRDFYFSMLNHVANTADPDLAAAISPGSFDTWLQGSLDPENFDQQTIETPTHFLKTYWPYKELPNIHLFHYEDMKVDLRGHIAKTADALNVLISDDDLDQMTAAATFENMQKNGAQFAPESGTGMWKQDKHFFANGKNAQWRGKLTEGQLADFDHRIAELLDPEQVAWLVRC
ncbi:MAG: aryl sulfotransferase [Candidatus Azotimanducaceae bacterium]|jgi:aryl sulfotransferase